MTGLPVCSTWSSPIATFAQRIDLCAGGIVRTGGRDRACNVAGIERIKSARV